MTGWPLSISPSDWRHGKYLVKASDPETFTDPPIEKLEAGQIRVLELHPGARDDELKCSIRVCTLDSAARKIITADGDTFYPFSYEAVSYVWGSAERNHVLKCNKIIYVQGTLEGEERLLEMYQPSFETEVLITENLKEMLLDLRDTQDARSLWIDGICINQEDYEERAEQVKQMRSVYSYAERVVVWLGTEDKYKARAAFAVARKLASWYKDETTWHTALSRRDETEQWQTYGFHVWKLAKDDLLFIDQQEFQALRDGLLGKEWFCRTWVYQELALARDVILKWGDEEMGWDVLETAVKAFMELSLPQPPQNDGHKAVRDMGRKRLAVAMVRDHAHKYGREDSVGNPFSTEVKVDDLLLESLLVDVRSLRATNPLDKIYGILGLLLPVDGQDISVDYTTTVRGLYIQISKHLFHSPSPAFLDPNPGFRPLRALCYVQAHDEKVRLPSWVADWSTSWATQPLCFLSSLRAATAREAKFDFLSHRHAEQQGEAEEPHSLLQIAGIKSLAIAETFEVDDFERQAEILTSMPSKYPLTNDTYLDVYLSIFDAKDPVDFLLRSRRDGQQSFWRDYYPEKLPDTSSEQVAMTGNLSPASPPITADTLKRQFQRTRLEGVVLRSQTQQADRPIRNKNCRVGFVSTNGFMGVVPIASLPGDHIVLLLGAPVPFVVREVENGCHELIGECYVFGLMSGEGLEDLDESRIEDIILR
ncbi:hypothetical protein PRZ48_010652 [Zasmidium cellare]|uniref:Heterokaryon incompatibility domain-containing protein n=1 Tax=Zasmidium cellare TaxID=395010 RepID=A0ABR0E9V2_ZASCE|nr:hypothetical protein PRZ48_010652 [Zasmidium cellare]